MMKKRLYGLITVLAVLVLVLAACGEDEETTDEVDVDLGTPIPTADDPEDTVDVEGVIIVDVETTEEAPEPGDDDAFNEDLNDAGDEATNIIGDGIQGPNQFEVSRDAQPVINVPDATWRVVIVTTDPEVFELTLADLDMNNRVSIVGVTPVLEIGTHELDPDPDAGALSAYFVSEDGVTYNQNVDGLLTITAIGDDGLAGTLVFEATEFGGDVRVEVIAEFEDVGFAGAIEQDS